MNPAARRARSWWWWPAVLALAIVVLLGIAWAALAVLFPPARLRAMVQRQLAISLAREVRFDDVGLGLFPPVRLSVRNPALAEAQGFGAGAVFRARAIDLDLDPWPLLAHRVVVRRLVLDGPELHVVLRPDGTTNLDGIGRAPGAQPPKSQQPLNLSLSHFIVKDGHVLVDDLPAARRLAFSLETEVALEVRGGSRFDTQGTTKLSGLAFGPLTALRPADLDRSLAALDWTIEHRGAFDGERRLLALETLALRFGGTRVALSGRVQDPGLHARVDLIARGSGIDLGEILGFLADADAHALHGVHGAGNLDFDLAIRGGLGDAAARRGALALPDLTGTLRVARGAFRYPGAPVGVEDLGFTAHFAPDSLGIPDLAARVAGQAVRARLAMRHFADPWVAFAVAGNVDLAAIAPMISSQGGTIAGRAALDLEGAGLARNPAAMAIDGRAVLADVRVKQPSLPKEITGLGGAIAFSQARATVSGLSFHAGASQVALDARIERPLALVVDPKRPRPAPASLSFELRSPNLDLADVMPSGGGGIVLPNATGGGKIAIERFIDQRLQLTHLAATVKLDPHALEVPDFRAAIYGGLAAGSMRLDLADTTHPAVRVEARLDTARVERLLAAWVPRNVGLSGALGMSIGLDGDLAHLQRTLTAQGKGLVANGAFNDAAILGKLATLANVPAFRTVQFRDLSSAFQIQHGRVFTGPATLHGPQGDWLVSGSTGLDGSLDYAVSVTVPPALIQQLGARGALAAGALADAQGRVLMDFKIGGTAREPKVAWDPQAMRTRLAGKVSEAITAQKQKYEQMVRDSLASRSHFAEDSARATVARMTATARESLATRGKNLLKNFFGGGKRDTSVK